MLRRYLYRVDKSMLYMMVGVVLILAVALGGILAFRATEDTVHTVVTHKERVCEITDGNSDCVYLIFTEDGTYKLTDTFGILTGEMRFNTSDVYGRVRVGESATIRYVGVRIGFTSTYPEIIEITQP